MRRFWTGWTDEAMPTAAVGYMPYPPQSDWAASIARQCPKCGASNGVNCRATSGRSGGMHNARRFVR